MADLDAKRADALKRTLIETMIELLEMDPTSASRIFQESFQIAAGQALTPRQQVG